MFTVATAGTRTNGTRTNGTFFVVGVTVVTDAVCSRTVTVAITHGTDGYARTWMSWGGTINLTRLTVDCYMN